MLTYLLTTMLLVTMFAIIYYFVSFSPPPQNFEKLSPFECGFNPLMSTRLPFSIRFFLLVVLFLIFDVETVLLFPYLNNLMMGSSYMSVYMLLSFLLVLFMGVLYEWYVGVLDWVN
uniref:NADH dehydrogenase subunit 3 n=1 Tax=Euglandina singleyana TaxID=169637 RepID=UPI002551F853|nr:NADH dehydrogenase subunit 3 [Euglandina singleyana]WFQ82725.1 NADH dehydrogenase subunit 3 [Euglandina singleyana]